MWCYSFCLNLPNLCTQVFLCKLYQYLNILGDFYFSLFQECSFNKLHDNTALRVSYQGSARVYSNHKCNRWYFKFNGNECSGPLPIDSVVYNGWAGGLSDIQRNHFFEGYCDNLARGSVSVELWVGKCSGYSTQGDAYTGWNSVSRIMIEEVPPSQ